METEIAVPQRRLGQLAASLRATASTSAPTPAPAPARAADRSPESEVLRVGFAGVHRSVISENGSWPSNSHNWASAFAASADIGFTVVGVYDNAASTRDEFVRVWAERAGWSVLAFSDFDEMLHAANLDILVVGTRQTYHSSQIVRAIKAGVRGIVCDKPLVTSLSEMDKILEEFASADAAGKPVAFAYGTELRWDDAYQTLCEAIKSGAIGEVTSITANGVGDCINHGSHWCDTMLMLLGDPKALWAAGTLVDTSEMAEDDWHKDDPPPLAAHVALDNGAVLTMFGNGPGSHVTLSVVGRKGRLEITNGGMAPGRGGTHATLFLDAPLDVISSVATTPGLPASSPPIAIPIPLAVHDPADPWPRGGLIAADLLAATRSGGTRGTLCGVEHARASTEIGFAIHDSNRRRGGRVILPVDGRAAGVVVDSRPWGN
jgi:predicted dehydrogenase